MLLLLALSAVGALGGFGAAPAAAQDAVRIGLPTKTYYPTIIAETALHQKLFEKEGIKAELTIYRSGGETFGRSAAQLGGGSQEGRRGQGGRWLRGPMARRARRSSRGSICRA
jgi:hypothetical protein